MIERLLDRSDHPHPHRFISYVRFWLKADMRLTAFGKPARHSGGAGPTAGPSGLAFLHLIRTYDVSRGLAE